MLKQKKKKKKKKIRCVMWNLYNVESIFFKLLCVCYRKNIQCV